MNYWCLKFPPQTEIFDLWAHIRFYWAYEDWLAKKAILLANLKLDFMSTWRDLPEPSEERTIKFYTWYQSVLTNTWEIG